MTKPNAVEEMMARAMASSRRRIVPAGPPPTYSKLLRSQIDGYLPAAHECLVALNAAGLAIVPHDWNHREEDWSLESVAEWLER